MGSSTRHDDMESATPDCGFCPQFWGHTSQQIFTIVCRAEIVLHHQFTGKANAQLQKLITSAQGRKTERTFFGEDLSKVSAAHRSHCQADAASAAEAMHLLPPSEQGASNDDFFDISIANS